jgi:hypothetical protein
VENADWDLEIGARPIRPAAPAPEQFQTWFSYLDDKEYPLAKKAEPKDFYDNSFVLSLEKSGFFQRIGQAK